MLARVLRRRSWVPSSEVAVANKAQTYLGRCKDTVCAAWAFMVSIEPKIKRRIQNICPRCVGTLGALVHVPAVSLTLSDGESRERWIRQKCLNDRHQTRPPEGLDLCVQAVPEKPKWQTEQRRNSGSCRRRLRRGSPPARSASCPVLGSPVGGSRDETGAAFAPLG